MSTKKALIISIIFHIVIVLVLCIGVPLSQKKTLQDQSSLVVDFVSVSEESKAPKLAPVTTPEKKVEKPKELKHEELKAEESKAEAPKPEEPKKPEPEIKKPKPPKKPKKTPKPKPKNLEKANVNLLKKPKKSKDSSKSKKDLDSFFDQGMRASSVGSQVTISEIDAIQNQIRKCWQVSGGLMGAENLVVDIDIHLSEEGYVTKAQIVDQKRLSDTTYRRVAESALRAVRDPKCNPLPIPKNKYHQMKNITMSFNPKDMF